MRLGYTERHVTRLASDTNMLNTRKVGRRWQFLAGDIERLRAERAAS